MLLELEEGTYFGVCERVVAAMSESHKAGEGKPGEINKELQVIIFIVIDHTGLVSS